MSGSVPIHGVCEEQFAPVQAVFEQNFEDLGQLGGRVAIIQHGETVVDLWGGFADAERSEAWQADTLVCCMSVTKGVVALCAHLLAARGQLDYDAPVAAYWPEFGQAGKQDITVREAMSHRASLAIIDSAVPGDALRWSTFVDKIAAQPPNWPVCTEETYHSVTIGYITGEIVRRIDGRPIQQFIAEELAQPLGAEFILGCREEDLERVILHVPNPDNELMNGGLINDNTAAMFAPMPNDAGFLGSKEFVKTVFPSGGGVSHGLALARLFAPFASGGEYRGVRLFSPQIIALASEQQWHHADSKFGNDFRVALGLLLHIPFNYWGREGNVGTAGAGGFAAFADPEHGVSYGFTPSRHTTGAGLGLEHERLVDALYQCL